MALVRIMRNPVKPFDIQERSVGDGQTVKSALKELYTDSFKEFSIPTLVIVNGKALMRSDWDLMVVSEGDILGIVTLPSEPITIFYAVVAVITLGVSIYSIQMAKKMQNRFDAPAADAVYSLSGQKNDFRVMEPIEVNYGKNRVWCSYAARPFSRYVGNDQWLYQLLCVGQGSYQINDVLIEDTSISNYSDVQYQIVQPNGRVTLIETNVETSPEVNGIEMFGINETGYTAIGPYNIVSANNRTKKIEVDLELPSGLYLTGNKGLKNAVVEAEFEYRQIDDSGNPVGPWTVLFTWYKRMATVTPQRFTVSTNVPEGRYQVRGRRTNNKDTSYKAGNTLKWGAVRAVIQDNSTYGNVTLVAIKAKASNNLNNDSASRINVDCTRLLKTRLNGNWTGLVPTRSICWAFYDVLTNKEYGAGLEQMYVDVLELERLDNILMKEGRNFDAVIKDKSTVWETLTAIAKAGRATPSINGTTITMVPDRPKTIPQGVFSVDNIVEGSFEWEVSMWDPTESDSIEATYIDPVTFLQESVNCSIGASDGLNPTKVDMVGCTNRDIAYRDGMYMVMQSMHQREAVRFKTGLEGIIPSFGDLISVQYPIPSFGQGTVVEEVFENVVIVEDQMQWEEGQQHYIMVRGDDGVGHGPYPVSRGSSDDMLVLNYSLPIQFKGGVRDKPILTFGGSTTFSRLCVVADISPQGDEEVAIECLNYSPLLYSYDNTDAPPIDKPSNVQVPKIPVVRSMSVVKIPDIADTVSVSWDVALGANSYILQQSYDGEEWTDVINTPMNSWQLQVFRGMLYLRVAGIGSGRGPYAEWSGEVGDFMGPPDDVGSIKILQNFIGTSFSVYWGSVLTAEGYRVAVYSGGELVRTTEMADANFTYTYEMAVIDGKIRRQYDIYVYALNSYGESGPVGLPVANPLPAAPTDAKFTPADTQATYRTYTITWEHGDPPPDLVGYKMYMSDTNGFTPTDGTLEFEGMSRGATVVIPFVIGEVNKYHGGRYIRVGAYDVWGDEVALSPQITIPYFSMPVAG